MPDASFSLEGLDDVGLPHCHPTRLVASRQGDMGEMMDTNKLWLFLVICTVIGSLIGLPRFLTYLDRLATETRQELDVVSSGSAYDGMIDAQEEEPTQPLPVLSVEETDQTYVILRARAYACCLETLLTAPEDVRQGI